MAATKTQYLVDESGERVGVLMDIAEYEQMLDELEELESIRAFDASVESGDEAVPFEQAVAEIESDRS